MRDLQQQATAITVMGDLSAAVVLEREGYATDMAAADDMLTRWTRDEEFQRLDKLYTHTWQSPSGPQKAHLYYVLTWSREVVQYSTTALESDHPGHDHLAVCGKFPSSFLQQPTTQEREVQYPTLKCSGPKWEAVRAQWQLAVATEVAEVVREGGDALTTMAQCWKIAYDQAFQRLRQAKNELQEGTEGTNAQQQAVIICTTPETGHQHRKQMLRDIRHRRSKGLPWESDDSDEDDSGIPTLPMD
eukprot:3937443-Rhodomonas_salina.1